MQSIMNEARELELLETSAWDVGSSARPGALRKKKSDSQRNGTSCLLGSGWKQGHSGAAIMIASGTLRDSSNFKRSKRLCAADVTTFGLQAAAHILTCQISRTTTPK